MSRLELVTECSGCLGTGLVTNPADAELVHCSKCDGSGGSRIPLDSGLKLLPGPQDDTYTVQDVLDALEALEPTAKFEVTYTEPTHD